MQSTQRKVLIVYPYVPHYRVPVFNELAETNQGLTYKVLFSNNTIEKSIKSTVEFFRFDSERISALSIGRFFFQWIPLRYFFKEKPDIVVFLGNPYFITTWLYSYIYRFVLGKKTVFWTHGWLDIESGTKAVVRKAFYRIPDRLFLYGNRAKQIGLNYGFSKEAMVVVYNSLDFSLHNSRFMEINRNEREEYKKLPLTVSGDEVYFCCVSRITEICKFDIAIRALHQIKVNTSRKFKLILIGSGPRMEYLAELASELGVELLFLGETYDEDVISRIVYFSRAVVSPGKAGLTVMHALAYGVPVISHHFWALQMPEFEAVVDEKSGSSVEYLSVSAMATALLGWANKPRTPEERNFCRSSVIESFNPKAQANIIANAILRLYES